MIIQTMSGIGDNIYFRPVLKWLHTNNVTLITPWPQVYQDIKGVKFAKPYNSYLRTQNDNIKAFKNWDAVDLRASYHLNFTTLKGSFLTNFFDIVYGQQPSWVDSSMIIPDAWVVDASNLINSSKPVCLIRPNTIRLEWPCHARNPKHEYLQLFIDMYRDKYHFVSIANLCHGEEFYEKELKVDQEILNCTYEQTVGLFKLADLIVCSPSFWMPLGIALNLKTLVIYGAADAHWDLNDKRMKAPRLVYVEPTPFHRCSVRDNNVYKDINQDVLLDAFEEVMKR